jgi:L-ascorbate metabolism protein UlaG (beta-lactamase superfamily)
VAEEAHSPDLVVISHPHRDHLDLPSLRLLPAGTPMVVPRGVASTVAKAGATEVVELSAGESVEIAGVGVTATEAAHDGRRDPWKPDTEPLGYLLDGPGRRIYFPGDTDLFDEMEGLGPLDVALLPISGWGPTLGSGHLDAAKGADALTLLRPDIAVPIHWGTFHPLGLRRLMPDHRSRPAAKFARLAAAVAPEVDVRVLAPGETTSLSPPGPAKVRA